MSRDNLLPARPDEKELAKPNAALALRDEEIYPAFANRELQSRAYTMYVTSNELTVDEIAHSLNVPAVTVQRWAALGEWAEERRKNVNVLLKDAQVRIALWRSQERENAAKKQAELGKKLMKATYDHLENTDIYTPDQLKKLAEAGKAAADIEARALNLGGISGEMADGEAFDSKEVKGLDGKTPLVVVIPGGGLPVAAKPPTAREVEEGEFYGFK